MKRIGIILRQLLVTAAGLCYVFHNPQRRAQIAEALRHASLSWVLLGWICYSVVEMLAPGALANSFAHPRHSYQLVAGWRDCDHRSFPVKLSPRQTKTGVSTSQD